jgi:hypothetical protein
MSATTDTGTWFERLLGFPERDGDQVFKTPVSVFIPRP